MSWRVLASSVAGASHLRAEVPCQDAHAWRLTADGVLLAAVADGAGSAPLADVGSRVAVTAALDALCAGGGWLDAADEERAGRWRGVLAAALDALGAEATARGVEPGALATTLTVLAASADVVAAAQVGDGAVVVDDGTGGLAALTTPVRGEYANETVFLTSPGAVDGAQLAFRRGPATYLAVLTDGLQALALRAPGGDPHPPFFAPLFRWATETGDAPDAVEQLEGFLRSPRVAARTDDDLTLLIAARVGEDE